MATQPMDPAPANEAPSVRTRERKPPKKAAETSTSPEEAGGRAQRSRKAPIWVHQGFTLEGAPKQVVEQALVEKAQLDTCPPAEVPDKPTRPQIRIVNWQMMGLNSIVIQTLYKGRYYSGTMDRASLPLYVGRVVEGFDVATLPESASRHCCLCNKPLSEPVLPGLAPDGGGKVVRVPCSTTWTAHVHLECALWAPEVFQDEDANLMNLHTAVRRARAIRCCVCKDKGAALCCGWKGCVRAMHLPCAHENNCHLDMSSFGLFCPMHSAMNEADQPGSDAAA